MFLEMKFIAQRPVISEKSETKGHSYSAQRPSLKGQQKFITFILGLKK
jgi:hypothetical protein